MCDIIQIIKDNVKEYREIETNLIDYSIEVRKSCEMNHCGQFDKNWMCPPAIGAYENLKIKYQDYKQAIIFTQVSEIEDAFDLEGMDKAREKINHFIQMLQTKLNEDYAILGVGSCKICKECTYPENLCRYPNIAFPSLEAIGINVVQLAKLCNLKYNNGKNTVTYFGLIFHNKMS